jgi:hypothetical protein
MRPPLTEDQVLAWAGLHHARTGRWPGAHSGAVLDAAGENWQALDKALRNGFRGLPGEDSLAGLLGRNGRE